MNRQQRRQLAKANGKQAHAPHPKQKQMTVGPVLLRKLDGEETAMLTNAREKAIENDVPEKGLPPTPEELCIGLFQVQAADMALLALAPDGTAVMSFTVAIPGGLLQQMKQASLILDKDGNPSGAAATLQNAMAGIAPRVLLGLRQSSLSEGASAALHNKTQEDVPGEDAPTDPPALSRLNIPTNEVSDAE